MAQIKQPLPLTPGASVDVEWDWSQWVPGNDSIASASITPSDGLAVSSIVVADNQVTAYVSIVDTTTPDGVAFSAVCTIITAATPPRTDSRTLQFISQNR